MHTGLWDGILKHGLSFDFNSCVQMMFTRLLPQTVVKMEHLGYFRILTISMKSDCSYLYRRCGVGQLQGEVLRHVIGGDGDQAV